jgi:hypothetical protein
MPGLMSGGGERSATVSLQALLKLGEAARAMATANTAQSPEPGAMTTAQFRQGLPPPTPAPVYRPMPKGAF